MTVKSVQVDTAQQSLTANAQIAADAQPGPRTLRLADPNGCVLASKDNALTIAAPVPPPVQPSVPTDQAPKKAAAKRTP